MEWWSLERNILPPPLFLSLMHYECGNEWNRNGMARQCVRDEKGRRLKAGSGMEWSGTASNAVCKSILSLMLMQRQFVSTSFLFCFSIACFSHSLPCSLTYTLRHMPFLLSFFDTDVQMETHLLLVTYLLTQLALNIIRCVASVFFIPFLFASLPTVLSF